GGTVHRADSRDQNPRPRRDPHRRRKAGLRPLGWRPVRPAICIQRRVISARFPAFVYKSDRQVQGEGFVIGSLAACHASKPPMTSVALTSPRSRSEAAARLLEYPCAQSTITRTW